MPTRVPGSREEGAWLSDEELAKCARADDVEPEDFRSPIPTRNVSNGEYLPKPQTKQQKQVEERIKELADTSSKKLGISRRKFLASSGGMAAALLAMNEVYGCPRTSSSSTTSFTSCAATSRSRAAPPC